MGQESGGGRRAVQRAVCFSLAACCMVMIFCFSAQTGTQSDAVSLPVARWLQEALPFVGDMANLYVRKAAHFSVYCLLSVFVSGGFETFRLRRAVRVAAPVGICALYAVGDELHQGFVANRTPAALDVCIDTAGALAGALLVCLCCLLYRRHRQRKAAQGT